MDLKGISWSHRDPNLEKIGLILPLLIPISSRFIFIWPWMIQPWVGQKFLGSIDPNLIWTRIFQSLLIPISSGLLYSGLYWYSLEWTRHFQTLLIPISSGLILLQSPWSQSQGDHKFMSQSSTGSIWWPSQYRSTWIGHGLVETEHEKIWKFGLFWQKSSLLIHVQSMCTWIST